MTRAAQRRLAFVELVPSNNEPGGAVPSLDSVAKCHERRASNLGMEHVALDLNLERVVRLGRQSVVTEHRGLIQEVPGQSAAVLEDNLDPAGKRIVSPADSYGLHSRHRPRLAPATRPDVRSCRITPRSLAILILDSGCGSSAAPARRSDGFGANLSPDVPAVSAARFALCLIGATGSGRLWG